jgi:hypothetical protein
MLVFLDTEFTNFMRPALISLALVSEDGREFYAERNDYPSAACSSFVRSTVLPLLGRVGGAICDRSTLTRRLRAWFEALPETAMIVCDFDEDAALLTTALSGFEHRDSPDKFGEILVLDGSVISDAAFMGAQSLAFSQEWPPHHALADARALRAGYRAWRAAQGSAGLSGLSE